MDDFIPMTLEKSLSKIERCVEKIRFVRNDMTSCEIKLALIKDDLEAIWKKLDEHKEFLIKNKTIEVAK